MTSTIRHSSLHASLTGTETSCDGTKVSHFRGIPYGQIPGRFERATLFDDWMGDDGLDCTRFGPQCPQNKVDVTHLLRIPKDLTEGEAPAQEEDEFRCLNLNVSIPSERQDSKSLLPVLLWIHGGSQVVSYPPPSHRCVDTTPLIAQSISLGKPIIIVTFNYRLNVFSFGDGKEKNLAIKDQKLAIEWVVKHIEGFGGDKNNITLAGESAGSIYVHAHIVTGAPVQRAILQSGTLHLSPPLPEEKGNTLISNLSLEASGKSIISLRDASPEKILSQLSQNNINTMWIQEEPELTGWEDCDTQIEELLIGDVEYESVIWHNGIDASGAAEIAAAFDSDIEYGARLRDLYGIYVDRHRASVNGALDFITDVRFALPVEEISKRRRAQGRTTYQYVMDEPNPWQASSRAHHALDLVFLFGAYDLAFKPAAARVALAIQTKWIDFVNGTPPWSDDKRFAFGPFGNCTEIENEDYGARRRVRCFDFLRGIERSRLLAISGKLAAGKISLHN
ncbi:carboxylesterase [Phlyctema vagabunda]|uniref:Carboxylic ester hydrolase n=1 Tax=Phlyctema vagabunda TaxID=108571 RepID=A0ABR4PTE8_9HELO